MSFFAVRADAQEVAPLVTDRPTQGAAAAIVPTGTVQIETGAVLTDAGADTQTLSLLTTLVRVGLASAVEARAGFAGWTRVTQLSGDASASGVGSPEVGAKVQLVTGTNASPSVAVLASALLPIGSDAFRVERVEPSVRVAVAHTAAARIGFGYNLGVRFFSVGSDASTETESEGLYTIAVGTGLSDQVGVFLEAFGAVALSDGAASGHSVNAGVTLLALHQLQFDLSAGLGYAGSASDWFIGCGAAVRLPR
jgi:hypothetical protein